MKYIKRLDENFSDKETELNEAVNASGYLKAGKLGVNDQFLGRRSLAWTLSVDLGLKATDEYVGPWLGFDHVSMYAIGKKGGTILDNALTNKYTYEELKKAAADFLGIKESVVNESERMETFLNTKMKNPVSGREVKVSSMINDESNPLYKKLQAKKAEIDGGGDDEGDDEMKEAKDELKELQSSYSEKFDETKELRSDISDLKSDISDGDEDMADMAKEQLEEKEGELEEAQDELDRIKSEIDEVKDWIKENG